MTRRRRLTSALDAAPQSPLRLVASGWPRRLSSLPRRRAPGPDLVPAPSDPPARRPDSGLHAFSYTNAAGTRAYALFVPTRYTDGPLPLVVMLHGGTQDAATFAAATAMNDFAESETFIVAYPQQARSANAGLVWNWFAPEHQRRDAGEPSLIAGITGEVMDGYGVDASRVYVAGFSAGGAMAAVMAAVYPDLYAAVGVHSGLAYGAADDVFSAFTAMRHGPSHTPPLWADALPLIVFHGDQDATVSATNAGYLIDQALEADSSKGLAGARATAVTSEGQVPGGHSYTRTCYQYPSGAILAECWTVHGGGHAWSGGVQDGSYTDPQGPNASAELTRFFREHPTRVGAFVDKPSNNAGEGWLLGRRWPRIGR